MTNVLTILDKIIFSKYQLDSDLLIINTQGIVRNANALLTYIPLDTLVVGKSITSNTSLNAPICRSNILTSSNPSFTNITLANLTTKIHPNVASNLNPNDHKFEIWSNLQMVNPNHLCRQINSSFYNVHQTGDNTFTGRIWASGSWLLIQNFKISGEITLQTPTAGGIRQNRIHASHALTHLDALQIQFRSGASVTEGNSGNPSMMTITPGLVNVLALILACQSLDVATESFFRSDAQFFTNVRLADNTVLSQDELKCLDGVTSNIQTQLNSKMSISSLTTNLNMTGLTASTNRIIQNIVLLDTYDNPNILKYTEIRTDASTEFRKSTLKVSGGIPGSTGHCFDFYPKLDQGFNPINGISHYSGTKRCLLGGNGGGLDDPRCLTITNHSTQRSGLFILNESATAAQTELWAGNNAVRINAANVTGQRGITLSSEVGSGIQLLSGTSNAPASDQKIALMNSVADGDIAITNTGTDGQIMLTTNAGAIMATSTSGAVTLSTGSGTITATSTSGTVALSTGTVGTTGKVELTTASGVGKVNITRLKSMTFDGAGATLGMLGKTMSASFVVDETYPTLGISMTNGTLLSLTTGMTITPGTHLVTWNVTFEVSEANVNLYAFVTGYSYNQTDIPWTNDNTYDYSGGNIINGQFFGTRGQAIINIINAPNIYLRCYIVHGGAPAVIRTVPLRSFFKVTCIAPYVS